MQDKVIKCQCGATFTFTAGEQKYYQMRGYQSPTRCTVCRAKRKQIPKHHSAWPTKAPTPKAPKVEIIHRRTFGGRNVPTVIEPEE